MRKVSYSKPLENVTAEMSKHAKENGGGLGIFGIQKYKNPAQAFSIMCTYPAVFSEDGVVNLNDESFAHLMYDIILKRTVEHMIGRVDDETFNQDLHNGPDSNDFLVRDVDFLYYSEKMKCFYTSRMTFRDDGNSYWDKHQWQIFFEMLSIIPFEKLKERAAKEAEWIINDSEEPIREDDDIDLILEGHWVVGNPFDLNESLLNL